MTLEPGKWITDRIRLEHRLGAGNMGEVWVAHHATLHTQVAVKFILDETLGSVPTAAKRFRREALNAARIRSPHVVAILDYDEMSDGTPYIVMELLEGEALDERIERAGPLSVAETAEIVRQVGKALDAAHELGIVHRDIKPGNIFLARTDHGPIVKVLDFGYAKSLEAPVFSTELSSPGMLAGSPAYVSRDLLLDPGALDHRADLWALGVTAFKCLTGELPFKGEWLGETCEAIIEGRLRSASGLRPELGPACDAWFARVFAAEPSERPASGAALSRSFDERMWIEPPKSWAPPAAAPGPSPARPRVRSRLAVGAAACFAVGSLLALGATIHSRTPRQIEAPSMVASAASIVLASAR